MPRSRLVLFLTLLVLALAACGGSAEAPAPVADIDLSALPDTVQPADVNALLDNPDVVVIDVREQYEYDEGHIPGVNLIPLGTVPNRLNQIPTDKTVILTCRSGNRSGQATDYLRQQGYDNVHNMAGGIVAWEQAGYEVEK